MMFKNLLLILAISSFSLLTAQKEKPADSLQLLKELSENACKCVDSISTFNKERKAVNLEINSCLDKMTTAYQLGSKLSLLKRILR